jgi:dihydroneopterin aldolase
MSNDALLIDKMEIACRVGITPAERAFPQIVHVSLRLELPLKKAGLNDNLKDTVDYAAIISDLKKILKAREFNLIEAVAEAMAQHLLKIPKITAVSIQATKKVFPEIESVGVAIYRRK